MEAKIQPDANTPDPRFAILWHTLPSSERPSHFDFMLENGEHLVTFELLRLPIPSERTVIRRLGDHRPIYLDFEGELTPGPAGENRGHVVRWAGGTYRFMKQTVAGRKLVVELTSDRFSGQVVLKPKPTVSELLLPNRPRPTGIWPIETNWEMYVSRWAMKEKSCSKT